MLIVGILIFFAITLLPGFVALRLLRASNLHAINALLYAVGLGLMFNAIVGLVANFTFGITLVPIVVTYIGLLGILVAVSYKFGKKFSADWKFNWKSTAFFIPIGIYLLAVALQYQTTLISPNLVGSDIHLEYYCASMTLENGFWDAMYDKATINACLGITILTPMWSLLTGMELVDVFRVICPLVFAFLPLVLYRIFKVQFGTTVAILSVVFFITMPMFTMDLQQLIRQQQSELFFILVVLLLMDDNLSAIRKLILGVMFGVGAITTHYGLSVGYVGYMLMAAVAVMILAMAWRKKREIEDVTKPILPRLVMAGIAVISLGVYVGYYSWVNSGKLLIIGTMPMIIVEGTMEQAISGVEVMLEERTSSVDVPVDIPSTDTPVDMPSTDTPSTDTPVVVAPVVALPAFFEYFPFINPLFKEPLTQTAIGLDFAKASMLGKIWRVLQYMVEICLIVGLFRLLLRPSRKVRIEYVAFIITSFFAIAGVFILSTHSWGLGVSRVWQVTLLFMSPLFVIGASTIGGWIARLKKGVPFSREKLVIYSTLVLLIPYAIFNLGVVFEVAKVKSIRFVDVPYSIALSGHRVDIASVFDKEDVEAVDWLRELVIREDISGIYLHSDVHGGNLLCQRIGFITGTHGSVLCRHESSSRMHEESVGYMFLRKWNVDNDMITFTTEYGCRATYSIDEYSIIKEKVESGTIIFDNGARIIRINDGK